jgi:acetaldehyde dehydrogenase
MKQKIKVAILGTGNIGTDLMFKIRKRSSNMELKLFSGIDKNSSGMKLAREHGVTTSARSIDAILQEKDIRIVFDATSAGAHLKHAPLLKQAGKIAIDLTPAAVGEFVIPVINLDHLISQDIHGLNVNMVTCGGQATIPIVYAISRVAKTSYAEIVATLASKSAGPGTRVNIDEFTTTTANGIIKLGKAEKSKAIILLNPADPPMMMNCTIYAMCKEYSEREVTESVNNMISELQNYIPGYRLKVPPQFDGERIMVMVQVQGAGDFLPVYAGNLDIMTSAAQTVGDVVAGKLLSEMQLKESV